MGLFAQRAPQILATEGGIVLTKDITYTLFNRLRELPEWSQCIVMGVLARYVPSNEDETFDILVRRCSRSCTLSPP
jgi:hypothetical protein